MKRLIAVFATIFFLVPTLASAQGLHCPGFVTVTTSGSPVVTNLYGQMNVRWNNSTFTNPSEYMYVSGSAGLGQPVIIGALDGNPAAFGYCIVSATSTFYPIARDLMTGGPDGSYIFAQKVAPSNECSVLSVQKHSCRQE